MIANVQHLSDDEKLHGIDPTQPTFVPYDKGDKGGNRWYLQTPFLIDWSKPSVLELSTSPKARFQNSQFYFREGFCWILTLNQSSSYQKARLKDQGVFDVNAMSLFTTTDKINDRQIVTFLNSLIVYIYKFTFINNTSAFQINDARQLPIVIPTEIQSKKIDELFRRGVELRKQQDSGDEISSEKLIQLQKEVDKLVETIYLGKDS